MHVKRLPTTLIEGQFSPEESAEILGSLFTAKIRFHEMKNFSSMERTGKPDPVSVKRLPQLRKELARILRETGRAKKRGEDFLLYAELAMTVVPQRKESPVQKKTVRPSAVRKKQRTTQTNPTKNR